MVKVLNLNLEETNTIQMKKPALIENVSPVDVSLDKSFEWFATNQIFQIIQQIETLEKKKWLMNRKSPATTVMIHQYV